VKCVIYFASVFQPDTKHTTECIILLKPKQREKGRVRMDIRRVETKREYGEK
jgi:hypothetical protein